MTEYDLTALNKDELRDLFKKSQDKILHSLADLFHGCDVDGDNLVNLTKDDFKELGLSFGQRKKVMKLIKNPKELFTGQPQTPTGSSSASKSGSHTPNGKSTKKRGPMIADSSGLLQHKRKREDTGLNGNNKRKKPNQIPSPKFTSSKPTLPPSPMNIDSSTPAMPSAPPPQMQEEEKNPMTQSPMVAPPASTRPAENVTPKDTSQDARPVWSRIPKSSSPPLAPSAPPPAMPPVPVMPVAPPVVKPTPPNMPPRTPPPQLTSPKATESNESFTLNISSATTNIAATPTGDSSGAEASKRTPAVPTPTAADTSKPEEKSAVVSTDPKSYGLGEGYTWDEEHKHFFNESTCRVYKPEEVTVGQYWDKAKKIYLKIHPNQYKAITSTFSVAKDATADKAKEKTVQAVAKATKKATAGAYPGYPAAAYPAGYTYPGSYTGGQPQAAAATGYTGAYAGGYAGGYSYQAAAQYESAARASMTTYYDAANLVFPEGGLKTQPGPATINYGSNQSAAPSAELYFQQKEISKQQAAEFAKIKAAEEKHKRLLQAQEDAKNRPGMKQPIVSSPNKPTRPRRRTSRFSSGPAKTTGLGSFSVINPPRTEASNNNPR